MPGVPTRGAAKPPGPAWALWRWATCALLCIAASGALAATNLVENGTFSKADQDKLPEGWYCRLADYMPKEQVNANGIKSYRYICGCGQDLGDVKPWCGLFCPKCKGFIGGEESGDWYAKNHERVSLDGGAVKFTLDKSTGENQGVRIFSHLIKVKRGWGYRLSFKTRTKGSIARVFVECFRYPDKVKSNVWEGAHDPALGQQAAIEKSYRGHVNCGSPADWQTFTKDLIAPKRYEFDFITVKLYAYMPGEAWFDDVVITPMTPSEVEEFRSKKQPKDDRFKYR
jgi:hypothetical protein